MQEWRLARQETLLGVQLIVSIQQRHALLNNIVIYVTLEKQKKKGGGNDHSTKITYSKRDAAVAGELPQRLNNTNVDPQLVGGEKCKIYDRVIYLK